MLGESWRRCWVRLARRLGTCAGSKDAVVSATLADVQGEEGANAVATQLGELLREHRRAAGLTQEELAERARVSPRSISDLEHGGAHVPRRDTIGLLARALGLQGADREAIDALIDERRRARGATLRLAGGNAVAAEGDRPGITQRVF